MQPKFEIKIATNIIKRLLGFMFKKKSNYAILFPRCNAIHTFFMKFEIDIIVLDNNYKVLKIITNIKKNNIIKVQYNIKNANILEIPATMNFKCKVGDTIIFK